MTLIDNHQKIIQIVANQNLCQNYPHKTNAHCITVRIKINTDYQISVKSLCTRDTMLS